MKRGRSLSLAELQPETTKRAKTPMGERMPTSSSQELPGASWDVLLNPGPSLASGSSLRCPSPQPLTEHQAELSTGFVTSSNSGVPGLLPSPRPASNPPLLPQVLHTPNPEVSFGGTSPRSPLEAPAFPRFDDREPNIHFPDARTAFQGAHGFKIGAMNVTSVQGNQTNHITHVHPTPGGLPAIDVDDARRKIREWLDAPQFSAIHMAAIDQHTEDTGMWFIESDEFRQLKRGRGCILWCTGMPGAGKTILASTSIKDLEDSFEGEADVAVVYVYLRYTEDYTLCKVFAAFLDQLLEHDTVVLKVGPFYREKARKRVPCTSEKDALRIFKDALGCFAKVFAVIDGLDEALDRVKDGLLRALPSSGLNVKTNSNLNALAQHYPNLATELSERIKQQADGMFLLARLQLEALMWKSVSVEGLFEALEKLPSGLDDMYHLTLERISHQPGQVVSVAHRVLVWLLHKSASHKLVIEDIQHALAVSIETQTFDTARISPEDRILSSCCGLVVASKTDRGVRLIHYTARELLKATAFPTIPHPQAFLATTCLVFAAHHADVVQSGVPEDRSFPFLDYACTEWGGHAESSEHLGEPLHPSIVPSLLKCPVFPFLVEMFSESVTPTLHRIGSQRTGFDTTETVMLPSLTVACMYGLVDVVKSGSLPFSRTPTILSYSYRRTATPFHSATSFGHFDTFIALLSTYGTQGIPLWTSKELWLPPILHVVVESPRPGAPFLQQLFDLIDNPPSARIRLALSEFDINLQDDEGNTALILACQNTGEDVVRLLISRQGLEVGLRNTHGYDAFHSSADHPESGVALLLLTHFPTLDIEAADEDGITTLMTACRCGHQQVIDYIRTKKPDEWVRLIRRTDLEGRTALMFCSVFPSHRGPEKEAILRTLTENGADLHTRETKEGMTTFLYAIHRHYDDAEALITHILKPLLAYDPLVFDQRDSRGRTALMLGLRHYRPDETLLKFLISLCPTPEQYLNLRDADGHSALMHAIGEGSGRSSHNYGRVAAVKILLASPAIDICLPDPTGRGILEVTCSAKWLFTSYPGFISDSYFPILDPILQANDGWDVSLVRKAVIAAVREMHIPAVYRLLLEDWVAHSFAWSLDDPGTVTLLAQVSTREWSCRAPVSTVLYRLGLLEPALLDSGIDVSNHGGLAETFCRNQDRRDCEWHSDCQGIESVLPTLFSDRRSYTPDELERMIPRTRPIPHPK
ncbi:hypothetical protein FA13DRAFT_1734401 [Coprinellus micaceus]|uniref:Uncharacterized protein n=1 Tax=Coprinellus micaceus TaxID=71717 RepID=A0A4Y7T617_COPMI|nr:hypothetical protein FA13DRAFT_1734401 [Coprinellus micaceus]